MCNFKKALFFVCTLKAAFLPMAVFAANGDSTNTEYQPVVVQNFLDQAKKNTNWKTAFVTGEQEQIVFMNISPATNPDNEIGMEVHPFDQVILIVEGKGKAQLKDKTSNVKSGDMLFIPKGTKHNVMNLDKKNELKIVSFYSAQDIPKDAVYKTKADTSNEE